MNRDASAGGERQSTLRRRPRTFLTSCATRMRQEEDGAAVMESLGWGAVMVGASIVIGSALEQLGVDIVDRIGSLIGV